MGLDAFVYCDCHERGRLLSPPPSGVSLRTEPDGSLGRQTDPGTLEDDLAWDQWREQEACAHTNGTLVHHRLGNIGLIAILRSELQREPSHFPVLLTKVLYNGIHGGDYIAIETIPVLQREVELLKNFKGSNRKAAAFISEFQAQMDDLISASLSVNKPIVF